MVTDISPSTKTVGFWFAVLATVFSITYVFGSLAEWMGLMVSGGGADLREDNLQGTKLQGADLRGADLTGVNLRKTKLEGANLKGAYLDKSELQEAEVSA